MNWPLAAAAPVSAPPAESPAPAGPVPALDIDDVRQRFSERVVPRTSRGAQLVLRAARVQDFDGTRLTLAVATEEIRQNTDQISQGLRGALEHEFKGPVTVVWVVDATVANATPPVASARPQRPVESDAAPDFDEISADDSAGPVVASVAEHLIAEMFPGAEEIS